MQSRWPIAKSRPYHWVSYAIVDKNWKLLSNRDRDYSELYDLAADPYEKDNLIEQKPKIAAALLKQIEDWKSTLPKSPTGDVFSQERKELR